MAKQRATGEEKRAIQKQSTKFDKIIQVKNSLEKIYKDKHKKSVVLSQKEVADIQRVLKLQPQLAITAVEE